jgi:hypothetical protein
MPIIHRDCETQSAVSSAAIFGACEMSEALMDYEADAGARLWELLERRNVGYRDRLKQSADTAGAQLEWAKPSVVGPGKRGVSAGGSVVMAPPGTIFIVLAHHETVFTIWLRPGSGTTTDAIEGAVIYARDIMKSEQPDFKWSDDLVLLAIEDLLKQYGRPPGKKGAELSQEHNTRIIGTLFAAVPEEARADMIKGLEMIVAMDVCPAMIGLIGDGTKTGLSGVWPLVLPLAPYVDTVIEA